MLAPLKCDIITVYYEPMHLSGCLYKLCVHQNQNSLYCHSLSVANFSVFFGNYDQICFKCF